MRPWTYIAIEKSTGERVCDYFQAGFDSKQAAIEFKTEYPNKQLEALLPGTHECTTFSTPRRKNRGNMLYYLGDQDG
jgi:hypothetical protein